MLLWDYVCAAPERALFAGLCLGVGLFAVLHAAITYVLFLRHRAVVYYALFCLVFFPVIFLSGMTPHIGLQEIGQTTGQTVVFNLLSALSLVFVHAFLLSGYYGDVPLAPRLRQTLQGLVIAAVASRLLYVVTLALPLLRLSALLVVAYLVAVAVLVSRVGSAVATPRLLRAALLAILLPTLIMPLYRSGLLPGSIVLPSPAPIIAFTMPLFCLCWLHGFSSWQREHERRIERLAMTGTFTAEFVHELANPVMSLEYLLAEHNAVSADDLRASRGQIERIRQMITNLRAMTQGLSHGESTIRCTTADVVTLAMEIVRVSIAHSRPHIEVTGEAFPIECRRLELAQAVANLIRNACEAIRSQEIERRWLRVTTTRQDAVALIAVRDGGPGIPPEVQARLMTPFFTTKTHDAGTGLGLSFSRRIATQMGGDLRFNAHAENTEFVLTVPISPTS